MLVKPSRSTAPKEMVEWAHIPKITKQIVRILRFFIILANFNEFFKAESHKFNNYDLECGNSLISLCIERSVNGSLLQSRCDDECPDVPVPAPRRRVSTVSM